MNILNRIESTRYDLNHPTRALPLAAVSDIPNLISPRNPLRRVRTSAALVLAAGATVFLGASPSANALPPVTNGLVLALDASALTGLSDGQQVNTWTDVSGLNNNAVRMSGSSTGYPQYVASGVNSLPVVRFNSGNGNTGDYFQFNRITTIQSVFWVIKENAGASDGHFLLGCQDAYDFHRQSTNGPLWNSGYASANIRNGTTKLMGTVINGTTTSLPASSFQLISLVTTGNVQANQITQDRVYHGSWQGDIAEILIYNRALTSNEEQAVGSYLTQKYQLVTTYVPLVLTVNVTSPTNNQAFPFGTDVTASATAQSGTGPYTVTFYQKTGAGAFAPVGSPQTAAGPTFTQDLGALANGSYQVYATVTDSASPTPATATSATNTFTVAAPTSTATTLGTSGTTTYGQTATFTATVAPTPNGGTVQFYADGNPLGTPVAVNTSTGAASYSTTLLTVPTHSITAHYSGFGIYLASDAAAISQTVNQAVLTVTADNKIRSPGDANPAFTYVISGFQNGENSTSAGVTGAPILGTAADTNSPAGNYPITNDVSPMAAANYSFAPVAGNLVVVAGAPPVVAANVLCWFEASQGVTNDGSGVLTWNDLSGYGHNATRANGTVTLVPNDVNGLPAVHLRGGNTYLNCAGAFPSIVKEEYLVVRSPNATWNGSGSFLGRASNTFLSVRGSSYNMDSSTTGFWQDHFPTAVSKNGTPVPAAPPPGPNPPHFLLAPITDYMILKITVDNDGVATFASYPNYQIGKNETLGTMDFDVAEIIGYDQALVTADESSTTTYLTNKYFSAGGYAGWAATYAGGQAANLDYNNDGVANGIAYFMGATGAATLPGIVNGQIAWPHDATATGVTWKVLTSPDLQSWTDVTGAAVDADGFVTYTLPTGNPTLFVRLKIEAP